MASSKPAANLNNNITKIVIALLGVILALLAYFATAGDERRCLEGHYETIGGADTTHPQNIWVCDRYIN